MMPKIVAVDLNIVNLMLDYQEGGEIEKTLEAIQKEHGGRERFKLTKEQFEDLEMVLPHRQVAYAKGGTTSNTLETMGRLGKGQTHHQIIGVLDKESPHSKIIEGEYRGSGVEIDAVTNGVSSITAASIILRYPNKPPITATYPGNAKEIVTPWGLPKDIINSAGVLYIPGSMSDEEGSIRGRFNPDVMDRLLEYRKESHEKGINQKLVVALPNTAFQDKYDWNWATESADVVVSNMENLKACFPMENGDSITQLQAHMKICNEVLRQKFHNEEGQVAFIYDGNNDAWVVTANEKIPVPAVEPKKKVAHPLGVEDSAYAGFLTGYLSGMGLHQSGHLAMLLAAAKQTDEWPSLKDPRAVVSELRAGTATLEQLDKCLSGREQRWTSFHHALSLQAQLPSDVFIG